MPKKLIESKDDCALVVHPQIELDSSRKMTDVQKKRLVEQAVQKVMEEYASVFEKLAKL